MAEFLILLCGELNGEVAVVVSEIWYGWTVVVYCVREWLTETDRAQQNTDRNYQTYLVLCLSYR